MRSENLNIFAAIEETVDSCCVKDANFFSKKALVRLFNRKGCGWAFFKIFTVESVMIDWFTYLSWWE